MQKLRIVITRTTIPMIFLLLSGCWSLRSAQGLSEGELNVNYVAPVAGSIRYGVVDNVETRFVLAFENKDYDLFFHTNKKDNSFNYGVSFGVTTINNIQYNAYGGFVVSKRINEYINPYVSVLIPYVPEKKKIILSSGYCSFGSDVRIPITKQISLLLTPEIGHEFKYEYNADFNTRGWILTGNVGFIFNLY